VYFFLVVGKQFGDPDIFDHGLEQNKNHDEEQQPVKQIDQML
jgi:hypothetical protein